MNNLKIINDSYGHDAGDKMLIQFANIFKTGICNNDVFGRIGGDEFTVIFINKNKAQVIEIMNKIYAFKNNAFNLNEMHKKLALHMVFPSFQMIHLMFMNF